MNKSKNANFKPAAKKPTKVAKPVAKKTATKVTPAQSLKPAKVPKPPRSKTNFFVGKKGKNSEWYLDLMSANGSDILMHSEGYTGGLAALKRRVAAMVKHSKIPVMRLNIQSWMGQIGKRDELVTEQSWIFQYGVSKAEKIAVDQKTPD